MAVPRGGRVDLLAVEPASGCLVIIELKGSERKARAPDPKKGGDAWQQAEAYAGRLHAHRKEFYPFFERLARVLARHHGAPEALQQLQLDPEHRPRTCVAWPGSGFRF